MEQNQVKAIAHITEGDSLVMSTECFQRMDAEIRKETWSPPRIFTEIQSLGNIEEGEMFKVFNMGIGMVLIVDQQSVDSTQEIIDATGLSSIQIGTVKANGTGSVEIV